MVGLAIGAFFQIKNYNKIIENECVVIDKTAQSVILIGNKLMQIPEKTTYLCKDGLQITR